MRTECFNMEEQSQRLPNEDEAQDGCHQHHELLSQSGLCLLHHAVEVVLHTHIFSCPVLHVFFNWILYKQEQCQIHSLCSSHATCPVMWPATGSLYSTHLPLSKAHFTKRQQTVNQNSFLNELRVGWFPHARFPASPPSVFIRRVLQFFASDSCKY